ncbi:biosynthetic peptidoglycan transglycosylase [Isorropodon fossajaponicum symbiont]|uniref:biosynthetic peptidoglycan transglycosylase n=1 Tax=Isorropodon fossajaponicum symbiont TaxID=883811 RepID=UPI001CECA8E4|nr:biosynthetic peptidoglycan transglycosylase [Isorropodon fossajaponicum symbiont]
MFKQLTIAKFFIILILLSTVIFAVYLSHLSQLLDDAFSDKVSTDTLSFEQQLKVMINMLLLMEDQSFFEHSGVDFKEISRVVRDYIFYDKPLRGASTITMQLIKNTLLNRERSLGRKVKEALMALLLEHSFDKKFILNRYINTVYLGQKGNISIHSFTNAARFYFNKDLVLLSLEEMVMLVALVKGPDYYHPVRHSLRLLKRKQLVLSIYHKFEKIVK